MRCCAILILALIIATCAPKMHDGKYTHEEYWGNEVHRGHEMDMQRHDAGHGLDCGANGILLDHCDDDSDIHRDYQH
jgi:hypothetical protein